MVKTVILAHYYTAPEVQQAADFVGDSLDLSMKARNARADRIIFAGVRFMAETTKILNPDAEVILPDAESSCSLVKETNIDDLKIWLAQYPGYTHVSYINSSVEHKALSDWIVTSRNSKDIISSLIKRGKKVIFSPDFNMGNWYNHLYDWDMPIWSATCEVHKKYDVSNIDRQSAYIISHPESDIHVLKRSDYVGSTKQLLEFVKNYEHPHIPIYVATEHGILYNMRQARPDLDLREAPFNKEYEPFLGHKGCECNSCPYMKKNTVEKVLNARDFGIGEKIEIEESLRLRALKPIERMLEFK